MMFSDSVVVYGLYYNKSSLSAVCPYWTLVNPLTVGSAFGHRDYCRNHGDQKRYRGQRINRIHGLRCVSYFTLSNRRAFIVVRRCLWCTGFGSRLIYGAWVRAPSSCDSTRSQIRIIGKYLLLLTHSALTHSLIWTTMLLIHLPLMLQLEMNQP